MPLRSGNHAIEFTIPSPAQPAALGQGVRDRAIKYDSGCAPIIHSGNILVSYFPLMLSARPAYKAVMKKYEIAFRLIKGNSGQQKTIVLGAIPSRRGGFLPSRTPAVGLSVCRQRSGRTASAGEIAQRDRARHREFA